MEKKVDTKARERVTVTRYDGSKVTGELVGEDISEAGHFVIVAYPDREFPYWTRVRHRLGGASYEPVSEDVPLTTHPWG